MVLWIYRYRQWDTEGLMVLQIYRYRQMDKEGWMVLWMDGQLNRKKHR